VKFLFATTEVNKVPVTVLSRCQRFDLKRIPAEKLAEHFARVAEAEQVEVDDEALAVIARAAEGSARDGLSLLDQAIAHGHGKVDAAQVREMLGLADRGRVRQLLSTVLSGDAEKALAELDEAHALGVEPTALLRGLMEAVHAVTRAKAGGGGDLLVSAEEREASADLAGKLGWGSLHRLWQMLMKGLTDTTQAPDPHEAASMVLLRIIHAAELPDPASVIARLQGGGTVALGAAAPSPPASPVAAAPAASATATQPASFAELVDLLDRNGKKIVGQQLHDYVSPVKLAPGELVIRPLQPLGADFPRSVADALRQVTGSAWRVELSNDEGAPSLRQQHLIAEEQAKVAVLADPAVAAVLQAIPGATLESVSAKEA
jgi:DNA polymerase-3 subunit gamma/tau